MATTVSHPSPYRTSPRDCGSHRLRRRGHAALAAGLRAGGQYPHGPAQRPLCQRAHGAHAARPRTGPARRRHPPRGWRGAQRRRAQRQQHLPGRHTPAHLHLCGLPEALAGLQASARGGNPPGSAGTRAARRTRARAAEEPPRRIRRSRLRHRAPPRWPISEAPASLNIKLKIGNMETHVHHARCRRPEAPAPSHHEPALASGDPARL